jgi:hypothetical protein
MANANYKILISMSDELRSKLQRTTRATGTPMSVFVRNSIEESLRRTRPKPSYYEGFWLLLSVVGLIWLLHAY